MRTPGTRSAWLAALLFIAGTLLAGCATPTSTRTTVVLLPEEDSTVGALSISTASGTQRLNQAFSYASVNGNNAEPSQARTLGRATVENAYGDLLKATAQAPRIFVLHFLLDKSELTEESKAMVPAMLRAVRARQPARITVFGHADATGSREGNLALSAERAGTAAALLRKNDPSLKDIDVQFFGDTQPLTPSDGRAADPKSRRVEILVF